MDAQSRNANAGPSAKRIVLLVLIHGLFGWGETRDRSRWPRDYWYGLQRFIWKEFGSRPDIDLKVLTPSLPPVDSIKVRGAVLQRFIEEALAVLPSGSRAHLIAHSRGGMDARWVIVQPGMADKIASLTTIGTAHRGTTFMSWAYTFLPLFHIGGKLLKLIEAVKRRLGMPSSDFYYHFLQGYDSSTQQMKQALYPLTFKGAAEFNQTYEKGEHAIRQRTDHPVVYRAYGGAVARARMPFLRLSHAIIAWFGSSEERRSGNDGATSVWSAHYPWEKGQGAKDVNAYIETVPFDHYELVNWEAGNERSDSELPLRLEQLYRDIIKRILKTHYID